MTVSRILAGTFCILVMVLSVSKVIAAVASPGHRLPDSPERPVRDRLIDILHLSADLRFDMERARIFGGVRVRFTPLQSQVRSIELDAFDLTVESVKLAGGESSLAWKNDGRNLRVELPKVFAPGEVVEIAIQYSAQPRSGLYFHPASNEHAAQAWNFGEGGLHYGWLPLFNGTNDRFAVDIRATVKSPLIALSNGKLKKTIENADGTSTYWWVQEEEIPNYLIALKVGAFTDVKLEHARVGTRTIPLSVWTTPGTELKVAQTFASAPRMLEFFSKLLSYPYPWAKYDQVTLRDFGGAMETATMVGFPESYQRRSEDPVDSSPDFNRPWPIWRTEDTISHEVAHHWFGDLVTCRSLGSLWLNESFATYLHTVWNGHANGDDDLTYQRWRYLQFYLDDVQKTGVVRPLEYLYYSAPDDMYRESITYIKGALVIHMLRRVMGDDDFYRSLARYLRANEFGEVDSRDLLMALERTTGRDLGWFFKDWILGGGGHPVIQGHAQWVPDRRQVDLTLTQVQSAQAFENLFKLPVDVAITTESGTYSHTLWMNDWQTRAALPADGPPLAISVDTGNWLIAEIHLERNLDELLYLLNHGDLAASLRAARDLSNDYPRRPESIDSLAKVLRDGTRHWGLRQEAALGLGEIGQPAAIDSLFAASSDADRRVRRAVVVALGATAGPNSASALRNVIENDSAEDVIAAASISLGRLHAEGSSAFLRRQLERESRWWYSIQIGALQGLAELEEEALVPVFIKYIVPEYPSHVRLAALDAWFRTAPQDPELAAELRRMTADRNNSVKREALKKLGELHREKDLEFLRRYASEEANPNLVQVALDAIEVIAAFTGKTESSPQRGPHDRQAARR